MVLAVCRRVLRDAHESPATQRARLSFCVGGAINSFASVVMTEQDCTSLPSSGFSQPSHKPAKANGSSSFRWMK
jgi:hypothetical protein